MRFHLRFSGGLFHSFGASNGAEVLFGVLDGIALYRLAAADTGAATCALDVEHTAGPRASGRWLEVWAGELPTEPARLGEYLEDEADEYPPCARPPSRAEALWARAIGVKLAEIYKGR